MVYLVAELLVKIAYLLENRIKIFQNLMSSDIP